MKRGFDGKFEVSITSEPDDSLQADAAYFSSISGRDILNDDYRDGIEESHSTQDTNHILSDDEPIYLKSSIANLVTKAKKDVSLCSLKDKRNCSPESLCLNDEVRFSIPSGIACGRESNQAQTDSPKNSSNKEKQESGENSKSFDPVQNTWVTTRADKTQLRNSGHTWKTGKWTKEETELLKSNIEKYCKAHNIDNPRDIIYNASKEDRPQFYPTVSAGLHRPVFSVYRRVRRMYDAQNYRGKYTPEEVEKLKSLYEKHGRDWALIGQEMGRSSDSVKDRCRLVMNGSYQPGKWSEEEEDKLAHAVYSLTGTKEGESITSDICWISVAKRVGTRNQKQCRAKWLNYLNWKLSNGEKWTKKEDETLLNKIIESGVQSEEEINWADISSGWKSSRSPQWLRIKWWSLKQYYLQEFLNISDISFSKLLQALSEIIKDQIENAWESSKRVRKPLDQILKVDIGVEQVPNKAQKMSNNAVRVMENNEMKKAKDFALAYLNSPSTSNIADKLIYVTNPRNEILYDGTSPENNTLQTFENSASLPQITDQNNEENLPDTTNHSFEEPISDISVPVDSTIELTPTTTPGVYLFHNSFMLVLSEDVNGVNFVPANNDITNTSDNPSPPPSDELTSNHSDVITTSDVLVYQETSNDEDNKNPILGSAINEAVASEGHDNDDDSCYIQNSSPFQGNLLEFVQP